MNLGILPITQLAIHKVGNKFTGEFLHLSETPVKLRDEAVEQLLSQYFLSAFKTPEYYRFHHETALGFNEVFNFAKNIFADPENFMENSANIARQLYEKSNHPKIKGGELYVVLFEGCHYEGEDTIGLGIFKSENKETFLKVYPESTSYEVEPQDGINISKLDKGCIIFHTEATEGYRVLVVDNTNKNNEAQYWKDDFLQIKQVEDQYFQTENYLKLCKNFITEQIPQDYEVSKTDQIDLLNRSVQYFKEQDSFDLDEFADAVIGNQEVKESFKIYKQQFEEQFDTPLEDNFNIHNDAVKRQSRIFKHVLKMDKNFHIYIHGDKDMIERGYDETIDLNYYKVYFKEEE